VPIFADARSFFSSQMKQLSGYWGGFPKIFGFSFAAALTSDWVGRRGGALAKNVHVDW
jgi:hypothetical protein